MSEEQQIAQLARDLEEPRALQLLAEWVAIERDETRLQADKYLEAAQELYDYLLAIGFRLIPLIKEKIEKSLLTDKEIDTQYLDSWAKRNTEVDSPLDLKAKDGDEDIDVLRELLQAQLDKSRKALEG